MIKVTIEHFMDNRLHDSKGRILQIFEIKNQGLGRKHLDDGTWKTAIFKYRQHGGTAFLPWLEWKMDAVKMDYKDYTPVRLVRAILDHYIKDDKQGRK